jgi:hypothetical protein
MNKQAILVHVFLMEISWQLRWFCRCAGRAVAQRIGKVDVVWWRYRGNSENLSFGGDIVATPRICRFGVFKAGEPDLVVPDLDSSAFFWLWSCSRS